MKPPPPPKTALTGWRAKLAPMVNKVAPTMRVVERATSALVHLQKPTIAGIVSASAALVSGLNIEIDVGKNPGWTMALLCGRGYLVEAFQAIGAQVRTEAVVSGSEPFVMIDAQGVAFKINVCGELLFDGAPSEDLLEWIRQVLDRTLPKVLEVHPGAHEHHPYAARALQLARLTSKLGPEIAAQTSRLLGEGRCILLEGRPGVGKSTMAQEIARHVAGDGRVVFLGSAVVGSSREFQYNNAPSASMTRGNGALEPALRLLTPAVVIVDDVDKINMPLQSLEGMRQVAKLVILTANNGTHDDVLDGALLRAGRVDEVFAVVAEHSERRPPFERLSEEDWNEVRDWPIAYQNEVEKRLLLRPEHLRLDDLRDRVKKKTRSGDKLY